MYVYYFSLKLDPCRKLFQVESPSNLFPLLNGNFPKFGLKQCKPPRLSTFGCRGIRNECCSIHLAGGQCRSIHFGCRNMLCPYYENSFFLNLLTPSLSYITHTHEPCKISRELANYRAKYKDWILM